ncbi:MAG: hypothetical protein PWP08_197 [Methanofollis sp.]|nr:hypothetical protein [Methanofollis sp.]
MQIAGIDVRNFKSFREASVALGRFNVIIGPNAAGKSNFVDIFAFLSDCAREGFANAVSLQGGGEYVRNLRAPPSETTEIVVSLDADDGPVRVRFFRDGGRVIEAVVGTCTYSLSLLCAGAGCMIVAEEITAGCTCHLVDGSGSASSPGEGEIHLSRTADGSVDCTVVPEDMAPEPDCTPLAASPLAADESMLENPVIYPAFSPLVYQVRNFFRDIGHYDLDPRLAKRAAEVSGRVELDRDGGNLAVVLRAILADPEQRRRAWGHVRELLPFIHEIGVEQITDRALIATLKEEYSGAAVPSFLVSDGTINLTALIALLYFEDKPVVIIEEPERNIHPHLIAKLVSMMQDVAAHLGRQILVTTHHPEVVKYGGMGNILLLKRDPEGYSVVTRPAERRELDVFLETMGIDELYVQDLL